MRKVAVIVLVLIAILAYVPSSLILTAPGNTDISLGNEEELTDEVVGTVSGRVMTGAYGAYDCKVIFTSVADSEGVEYSVDLDSTSNGNYSITLPVGEYSARAESETSGEIRNYSETVSVLEGQTISGVDFEFERSFILTGQVRNVEMYLSGVAVSMSTASAPTTNRPSEIRVTYTDDYGRYQFTGLSAGTYSLVFQKDGYKNVYAENIEIGTQAPYFNTQMYKAGLPGINGFIQGYDFQHSMMVVGIVGIVVMIGFALAIWSRITKNPNLILEDEEDVLD